MKNIENCHWKKSSFLGICIVSIFLTQIASSVALQQSIEPHDDEIDTTSLKHSTESPESDSICPHCNILQEMPMELAEKINDVYDVDIFIHDFVEDTNSLTNITYNSGSHPANRKRRAASTQLRQATCQPVDTVVSLVPANERDPTVFYFPSCILMKQCGGCCAHTGTTCSPTDETEKQVTIKKTKFTGGSKLQAMGEVTMTVKEHNRCRCMCKKTASDCNSLQRFVSNRCACECLNLQAAEECAKDSLKLWDTKTCGCVCRDEKDCSSGFEFQQSTCSCQPITADESETNEFDFGEHTYNETFEANEDTKYYAFHNSN